jgi:hypothetical protein
MPKGIHGRARRDEAGTREFHEFPYSCVCKKPFSDDETGYMEPVTKVKSTYNQKKVGEKSLPMLKKTNIAEEPTALADSEDNEFLSD